MPREVVIAVDALGGDNAPQVVLDGVETALHSDADLTVVLCGPADVVEPFAETHERCIAKVATEVIGMGEHPAEAVRHKKDSSIVVGCREVQEGRADGFFSAGSTGACLAAGTLVIGRIKGIKRPMLVTIIPSPAGNVLLCDVGANADCKPEYLVQFAQMGRVFSNRIMGVEEPRVGLLNIGEEDTKGSTFYQECFQALKDGTEGFLGNAEPYDLMNGKFDVVVADGFTGNIALKTIESTAKMLFKSVKGILTSSLKTKIGALCIKDGLKELAGQMSADTYGGAPLLGVKGACIVGHGSSNSTAIANGIHSTVELVRTGVSDIIQESMQQASVEKAGE